jgi:sirohydrochlorin cobaltochelatase
VVNDQFRDAALVLVGHGSTRNADSSATIYQHAAELRRRHVFGRVLECFWKQQPKIAEVVGGESARRVFIVPVFISEGYFTEEAIPRELGLRAEGQSEFARVQQRGGQALYYCAPIGTHASMTRVLLARARQVVEQHPFPRAPKPVEIALLVAGHGTTQNENSRKAIERQVELIRDQREYAEVYPAFIEEDPRIADCYRAAQAKNIVMIPFFISDGMHVREDIPVLLGESRERVQQRLQKRQPTWRNPTERHGKRLWYSASIGSEPQIADVILERVVESCR